MEIVQSEYLELRPVPQADLERLLRVYQGTPLYFDALGDDVERLSLADVEAQWQAARTSDRRALFGVYHRVTDLLIGAVDVAIDTPVDGAAAIWILIWGGFQRQGYGQDCMAMVEHWLAEHQQAGDLWAIAAENEEGLNFLAMQGFMPTGEPAPPPVGRGRAFWMRRAHASG